MIASRKLIPSIIYRSQIDTLESSVGACKNYLQRTDYHDCNGFCSISVSSAGHEISLSWPFIHKPISCNIQDVLICVASFRYLQWLQIHLGKIQNVDNGQVQSASCTMKKSRNGQFWALLMLMSQYLMHNSMSNHI